MTLSSLARTKLILATADRETATWCSDIIGHREVREMEEGYSYGYNNARDAVSLTPRRQVVPLLLPDEFMGLRSLEGFIKFPDGFPAAPVTLSPRDWPRRAEGFIARDATTTPPSAPASTTAEAKDGSAEDDTTGNGDDGDPRKMKDRNKPQRQPSRSANVNSKSGPKVRDEAEKATNKQAKQAHIKAVDESQQKVGHRPPEDRRQGELPLPERPGGEEAAQDVAKEREGSPRSDVPDPDARQRDDDQRGKADRKLQEEQQRSLLGGAAHDKYDHDLGDVDAEI